MHIEYIVTYEDINGNRCIQFFDDYLLAKKRYKNLSKRECVSCVELGKSELLQKYFKPKKCLLGPMEGING